eukprot:CAMPEP_0181341096 /NCGR_PEP_ID=MMETSP1101-20121128/30212_1 /TAXON_ID=46948 /ORGANISM="Rhodomonas abbreviata, Strain Caron Lab Isolate" /LENGTH=68 /DNA_ID=CAMNT_0023452319 /DNA_START=73 /DNA_END=275 /DNA_ORIENTATION=-
MPWFGCGASALKRVPSVVSGPATLAEAGGPGGNLKARKLKEGCQCARGSPEVPGKQRHVWGGRREGGG